MTNPNSLQEQAIQLCEEAEVSKNAWIESLKKAAALQKEAVNLMVANGAGALALGIARTTLQTIELARANATQITSECRT